MASTTFTVSWKKKCGYYFDLLAALMVGLTRKWRYRIQLQMDLHIFRTFNILFTFVCKRFNFICIRTPFEAIFIDDGVDFYAKTITDVTFNGWPTQSLHFWPYLWVPFRNIQSPTVVIRLFIILRKFCRSCRHMCV